MDSNDQRHSIPFLLSFLIVPAVNRNKLNLIFPKRKNITILSAFDSHKLITPHNPDNLFEH